MTDRSQPLVAFVTVNWRSADVVGRLVESLHANVEFPYEAVVVNNDPVERSRLETICGPHPHVSLEDVGRNVGFAAACNAGAARTTAAWLLFINPDVRVEHFPADPLKELERRNGRRVLFGVTLFSNGTLLRGSLRRFPTFTRLLIDSSGIDRVVPFARGSGMFYRDERGLPGFAPIEQPTGAFFGIGREVYEELNGFDERFFVFFEEVDLALRAWWEGIPIVKLPDVIAEHDGGHSTRHDRTLAIGLRWQSLRAFCAKHHHRLRVPPPGALITTEALRFSLQQLVRRRPRFSARRALRISRGFGLDRL